MPLRNTGSAWIGVVAAVLAAAPAHASDAVAGVETAAATLAPNQYVWADTAAAEPVSVVVSIPDQRAYVYRGEALVAVSTVSTGRGGNETPAGVYPILQKRADHRSNLYDDAAMPFMQRLTWDGIAIHAGRNPGFPDSHGCIRVPTGFAKKLFGVTAVGTDVTVVDSSVDGSTPSAGLLPADVLDTSRREAMEDDRVSGGAVP